MTLVIYIVQRRCRVDSDNWQDDGLYFDRAEADAESEAASRATLKRTGKPNTRVVQRTVYVKASQLPWRWKFSSGEDLPRLLDANGIEVCWFGNNESYYPTAGNPPSLRDMALIVLAVNRLVGKKKP